MTQLKQSEDFMRVAIDLARQGVVRGDGGPFGAVIVHEDKVIGQGWNRVVAEKDPTSHAEINAIRDACQTLGDFSLAGCELYTSCEPCPMCMAAAYWARLRRVWYAAGGRDAAAIGFDDNHIKSQLTQAEDMRSLPHGQLLRQEALEVFRLWSQSANHKLY